ncbi:MAG TPA: hypothetical protein VJ376_09280, partial [Pseudomonadota bacterium]|nr:hypothetical protein [Pseudomonadota bacterium]
MEYRRIDHAIHFDVLERLEPLTPVGAATALLDGAQDPGAVACNGEDRMRQEVQRECVPRQCEADRI